MRSEPATLSVALLFEEDRSGITAGQSGMKAVNHFESSPDIGRVAGGLRSQVAAVGVGGVVIGALWLALYVIAVVHTLTFEHRPPAPIPNTAPANVRAQP
jgi:hypothetical protein